jgi:hypothetical protein
MASVSGNNRCYSLDLECLPKAHVLKDWYPVQGTIHSRTFWRWDPVGVLLAIRVMSLKQIVGSQSLPLSLLSQSRLNSFAPPRTVCNDVCQKQQIMVWKPLTLSQQTFPPYKLIISGICCSNRKLTITVYNRKLVICDPWAKISTYFKKIYKLY